MYFESKFTFKYGLNKRLGRYVYKKTPFIKLWF